MARKQTLIHLHTSKTYENSKESLKNLLKQGEIAVQHTSGETGETALITKNYNNELVKFNSTETIQADFNGKFTTTNENVSANTSAIEEINSPSGEHSVTAKINKAISGITANAPTGEGGFVTGVTQENGKITVQKGGIKADQVKYGLVEGSSTTYETTVQKQLSDVIGKASANADNITLLQNDMSTLLGGEEGAAGSIDKKIADAISGITANGVEGSGKFVTSVAQTNGKITVSKFTPTKDDISGLTTELEDMVSATNEVKSKADTNASAIANLASATHFRGVATNTSNVLTPANGDIVVIAGATGTPNQNGKEFIYSKPSGSTSGEWIELGDTTAEAASITNINKRIGDGFTESDTVAKKIDAVSSKATANANSLTTLTATGNAKGSINKMISDALGNVKTETDLGGSGKYITTISQANGKVSATAADLKASAVKFTKNSESTLTTEATTVQKAIDELEAAYKLADTGISQDITGLNDKVGDSAVSVQIATALGRLSGTTVDANSGNVVTDVTQSDGNVTVTKGKLSAKDIKFTAIEGLSGANVNEALTNLKSKIAGVESTAGSAVKSVKYFDNDGAEKTSDGTDVDLTTMTIDCGEY